MPFHADESTLLFMSRDYAYQFMQRDLDRVRYQPEPISQQETDLRLLNGSVSKYAYGLAWHLAGYGVEDTNEQWDWGADWNYNTTTNHAPSAGIQNAARYASSLMLVGSVVALFVLGRALGGRIIAYAATLMYALHPVVLVNGRRAVFESALLLGALLVVLAGVAFVKRPTRGRAALLGLAAGLALSGKHTNVFVIAPVFAVCALYPFTARSGPAFTRWRVVFSEAVPRVLLAAFVAAAVFVALNPVWWGAPLVEQGRELLAKRSDLLALQVEIFGGYGGALEQAAGWLRHTFAAQPQYFEVTAFGEWISDQIARYEASMWRGVALPGVAMIALCVLGAWAFARESRVPASARALILACAVTVSAATLLLTPLDWQRYYLPAYPFVALLAAFGVSWLLRRVRQRFTSPRV